MLTVQKSEELRKIKIRENAFLDGQNHSYYLFLELYATPWSSQWKGAMPKCLCLMWATRDCLEEWWWLEEGERSSQALQERDQEAEEGSSCRWK